MHFSMSGPPRHGMKKRWLPLWNCPLLFDEVSDSLVFGPSKQTHFSTWLRRMTLMGRAGNYPVTRKGRIGQTGHGFLLPNANHHILKWAPNYPLKKLMRNVHLWVRDHLYPLESTLGIRHDFQYLINVFLALSGVMVDWGHFPFWSLLRKKVPLDVKRR